MIGRLGIPASSGQSASTTPSKAQNGGASLGQKMQSISSLTSRMKLKDLTKKVSAGLNIPLGVDNDKKAKIEAEEKKAQIAQVLAVLDDICLQAPTSHLGLILAFNGKTMCPIQSPGIKFTWFRMGGEDKVDQVQESSKAWYAPTVDDVGCQICVQCEDTFGQGYSRYLECGPIRADPLVSSAAEAALDFGSHEAKGVSVSLGLREGEFFACPPDPSSAVVLGSVLDPDLPFLQLQGQSTVEVDSRGVFISIPTFNAKHRPLNTSRRGLRLPCAGGMEVRCAQPGALLLRVPITRKNSESPGGESEGGEEEEKMRRFLSSSILSIPWVYEGHHLSPQAYLAENESRLSPEERERIVREAEEDGIVFANTVVKLTEFVSSLPEGSSEVLFSFLCGEREQRDVLCCALRSLACMEGESTRIERSRVLPWLQGQEDGDDEEREEGGDGGRDRVRGEGGYGQERDGEMRKKMRGLEAANLALKKERNELTLQLLELRENKHSQHNNTSTSSMSIADAQERSGGEGGEGWAEAPEGGQGGERERTLLLQVIELENRLGILTKREGELERKRGELEERNAKLTADGERSKRGWEESAGKLSVLQGLYERQGKDVQRLERELGELLEREGELREREGELECLRVEREEREGAIEGLRREGEELRSRLRERDEERAGREKQWEEKEREWKEVKEEWGRAQGELEGQVKGLLVEKEIAEQERGEWQRGQERQRELERELEELRGQVRRLEESEAKMAAELKYAQQRSESQGRDLKRVMRENAMALGEYEKALVRKSEECNDLYNKINMLIEREQERERERESKGEGIAGGILGKLRGGVGGGGGGGEGGALGGGLRGAGTFLRRLSGADRSQTVGMGIGSETGEGGTEGETRRGGES